MHGGGADTHIPIGLSLYRGSLSASVWVCSLVRSSFYLESLRNQLLFLTFVRDIQGIITKRKQMKDRLPKYKNRFMLETKQNTLPIVNSACVRIANGS